MACRLMLVVALTGLALASLVDAMGVMDLLKSNMKRHKSPYAHEPQYAGSGGYGYGHQYESAYAGHPGPEAYAEPGYGAAAAAAAAHSPYGAQHQYNPYSSGPARQAATYGRYGGASSHQAAAPMGYQGGYQQAGHAGLDYSPAHLAAPSVYEPAQHHSAHGAGHLYGGGHVQRGAMARPHLGGGGSASSSAAAGAGGAAASAAAGGSSAAASSAAGRVGDHHRSKYAHLNPAASSMHHNQMGGAHLEAGMHYGDGLMNRAAAGQHHMAAGYPQAGHLGRPSHHSMGGLDFELGQHQQHGGQYQHEAGLAHGPMGPHGGPQHAADEYVAAASHNEPEVYHNTELLPDGHKTSTFVDYQEKPVEQTMASASGTFSTDDQGIERSSYSRSTEHVQNKEDGHIDDDHYYQAQSYGKTHDDHLHEASNRDDEDYEVTPTGYRKKKRKGNYVKNHTKTTRETGSGVLAKDRHQAGFSKSVNKLVENVNKNKVSHINGVAHDENLSSSQNIDDGDEDFYDSDLARRGHNIPGPHVPTSASAGASSASAASSGGSGVTGTGGGASASSAAGPGGVSSSAAAGL